ncbi:MAG: serine/threonine-protein kinase, partial [Polyangiaceae bacterium]
VMHPHLAKDEKFRHMFLDEARLAAGVHHPNVVATIDVQRVDGAIFLVMDYVEGPTLHALRRHHSAQSQTIPLSPLLRIMIDALHGLQAAHELCDEHGNPLDLVHRDVTPQNILVGKEGSALITDFGVARAASRLVTTQTGQIKGKIPYMAPEQLAAGALDARTDIYAVGATLWEMLTGRRLFKADNHAALITKVVKGPTERPSDLNPQVPEPIDSLCMRALSMSADDRPATALDFAEQLEEAAAEAGIAVASKKELARFVAEHKQLWQTPTEIRVSSVEIAAPESTIDLDTDQEIDVILETTEGTAITPTSTWIGSVTARRVRFSAAACVVAAIFVLLLMRNAPTNSGYNAQPASPTSSTAATVAAAPSSSTKVEPVTAVLTASPSTSPTSSPAASATAAAKTAPSSKPQRRRSFRRRRHRAKTPSKSQRGTDFRPSGL